MTFNLNMTHDIPMLDSIYYRVDVTDETVCEFAILKCPGDDMRPGRLWEQSHSSTNEFIEELAGDEFPDGPLCPRDGGGGSKIEEKGVVALVEEFYLQAPPLLGN